MTSSMVEQTVEKQIKENLKPILPGIVNCPRIFSEAFMRRNTRFKSIFNFLKAGHFTLNTLEDYTHIPPLLLDRYVKRATRFHSWKEMYISAATIAYNTPAPAAGNSRINLRKS